MSWSGFAYSMIFLALGLVIPSPATWLQKHFYSKMSGNQFKKIVYNHYKQHAMRNGTHQPKTPINCSDDGCKYIN